MREKRGGEMVVGVKPTVILEHMFPYHRGGVVRIPMTFGGWTTLHAHSNKKFFKI
jgi:vacuolar-type H+-ATPase catalytic subunit A/Vma1